ncbi:Uma2 family endonuclease [Blastochloris sulfoviridis]|nr:Uma2 family endonuclease [Blastochloris sulfoviridis]
MGDPLPRDMTVDEFLVWQLDQDERFELVDGRPVPLRAMTGASNVHDVVTTNLLGLLWAALRGKPCRVATADTALRTKISSARRPDVTIDCASPERTSYEARHPVAVFEVLSPSTRKIDRFTKLEEYRRHPALRHIVLIDPDAVSAKHYHRSAGGEWADEDLNDPDAAIALERPPIRLNRADALSSWFIAFSFAKPVPTFAENALEAAGIRLRLGDLYERVEIPR